MANPSRTPSDEELEGPPGPKRLPTRDESRAKANREARSAGVMDSCFSVVVVVMLGAGLGWFL